MAEGGDGAPLLLPGATELCVYNGREEVNQSFLVSALCTSVFRGSLQSLSSVLRCGKNRALQTEVSGQQTLTGHNVGSVVSVEGERGGENGGVRSGAPVDTTQHPSIVHIHRCVTVYDCRQLVV